MKTKKILPLLFLAGLFAGCQAHMIETRGEHIQIFGKKPKKGGAIRYLRNGLASMRNARRKDAERQMKEFCKGPYTITAEGPRSKFGASMPIPKEGPALEMDEYQYIAFECEAQ